MSAVSGEDRNSLLSVFMEFGELMLMSGAEVYRVEDTLMRMGAAYGVKSTGVFVITSDITVTLVFDDDTSLTQVRRMTRPAGTDFRMVEELNKISRECCRQTFFPKTLKQELDDLKAPAPDYIVYLGSIIAASSCSIFFGGSAADGIVSGLFGLFIACLQLHLDRYTPNKMAFNLIASLAVGSGVCLLGRVMPMLHPDLVMIGDIMLLIPGLALTISLRDLIVGDTLSGAMRFLDSLLWALGLAIGFMVAIYLFLG